MFKRTFKSLLLMFSIFIALVLVWQIWFSGYFLPDGYDYVASGFRTKFVAPIMRLFGAGQEADFSHDIKKLFIPEKIVLNYSGERRVLTSGQEDFETMYTLASETTGKILSGEHPVKSKEIVDLNIYFSLLKGKSIYVDYGKEWDFRLFSSAICGRPQNQMTNDINTINGYIISLHDGIMNDVSLYMQDQKNGNIYRYVVEIDKNALDAQLKEYLQTKMTGAFPSYSFELNFHKEQTEGATKILFEPLILMNLVPEQVPQIQQRGSIIERQALYDELTETVLEVFSINNRTMGRYTDLDNARVFIENNATLTMYPDGLLEYHTVQGGRGLDISGGADKTNYDIYTATANAVDFVSELCKYLPNAYTDNLQINTNLVNNTEPPGSYRLTFDYVIDGMTIRHQTEQGYAPTITLEITNGYLTFYRQYIKAYEKTDLESWDMVPVLTAADGLVSSLYNGENPLQIEKISRCYVAYADGTFLPKWNSLVDGREQIIE